MEWQKVETAPQKIVVLVVSEYGDIWLARFVFGRWCSFGKRTLPFTPTHWMPLPPPPSNKVCT